MGTTRWYPRYGDVPGIDHTTPVGVDRSRLAGHDAVPTVQVLDFNGRRNESLWWPTKGGSSTQSPARAYETSRSSENLLSRNLIHTLYEALELPGILTDYHFAIQGCAEKLWKRRRHEPNLLSDFETICWLDVHLLEACPDQFLLNDGDANFWPVMLSFGFLIRLYTREGYLHEAFDVATRATHFQQYQPEQDSLKQRIAALVAEEGMTIQ